MESIRPGRMGGGWPLNHLQWEECVFHSTCDIVGLTIPPGTMGDHAGTNYYSVEGLQ